MQANPILVAEGERLQLWATQKLPEKWRLPDSKMCPYVLREYNSVLYKLQKGIAREVQYAGHFVLIDKSKPDYSPLFSSPLYISERSEDGSLFIEPPLELTHRSIMRNPFIGDPHWVDVIGLLDAHVTKSRPNRVLRIRDEDGAPIDLKKRHGRQHRQHKKLRDLGYSYIHFRYDTTEVRAKQYIRSIDAQLWPYYYEYWSGRGCDKVPNDAELDYILAGLHSAFVLLNPKKEPIALSILDLSDEIQSYPVHVAYWPYTVRSLEPHIEALGVGNAMIYEMAATLQTDTLYGKRYHWLDLGLEMPYKAAWSNSEIQLVDGIEFYDDVKAWQLVNRLKGAA